MDKLLKLKNYLLPFCAGALLPLAFSPFNFWPLAIIAPLLFLFSIDMLLKNSGAKATVYAGFSFWLAYYLVGVSWVYVSIHDYGDTAAPIAAFLTLLFSAGLALVTNLQIFIYVKLNLQKFYLLSFPATWVLIEWFRSWFLTGFPWLYSGYAFIDSPLAPYASIGGVYFLSFIAVFLASLLYFLITTIINNKKSIFNYSLIVIFSFITIFPAILLQKHAWVSINPENSLRFHLIQGNIPQHDKWLPENQKNILITFNDLIQTTFLDIEKEQSEEQKKGKVSRHVIVLPEAAMPTLQSELDWFFEGIDQQAKAHNTTFISGIFYDENGEGFYADNIYNSVTAIGNGSGLYHKQRLVPFGEYVPLESFIRGMIPFFDLPYSSFARGQWGQQGLKAFDVQIAPFICYEILYPSLVFHHAKDADILLTISNDAWFGNSTGPEQHFEMARMRALELGKYLVRTTNTGTTAIIDQHGKILSQLRKDTRSVLHGDVYITEGKTPFARVGNLPILLSCAFLLFLTALLSSLNVYPFSQNKTDNTST